MSIVEYCSFEATEPDFLATLETLLISLPSKDRVLTIQLFGNVESETYLHRIRQIDEQITQYLPHRPLFSLVPQTPEDSATLIAEVGYASSAIALEEVHFHESPLGRYLTIDTNQFTALLLEGVKADDLSLTIGEQSELLFDQLDAFFQQSKVGVHEIVRQWNYIGDITGVEEHQQNYQEFNNARSRFYNRYEWPYGYPAATGISIDIRVVSVSLVAIHFFDNSTIVAFNNPLQQAAHRYSEQVLGESQLKLTPKFERAKLFFSPPYTICYVSGTASILGEKSCFEGDVVEQTKQTISLIHYLISTQNQKESGFNDGVHLKLVHLRVYVKYAHDIAVVKDVVEAYLPGVNVFFVCAGVCRNELLVEIEGVATSV